VIKHYPFLLVIGLLCSVFDILYLGLLWRARHQCRPASASATRAAE
jgi:hypothetical protein